MASEPQIALSVWCRIQLSIPNILERGHVAKLVLLIHRLGFL